MAFTVTASRRTRFAFFAAFFAFAAAADAAAQAYAAGDTRRFVGDLLANLFDYYERPIASDDAAIATLGGLSKIDARFAASGDPNGLRLHYGDVVVAALPGPDRDTAKGWAAVTAQAVDLGRGVSEALSRSDAETLYAALAEGALEPLDPFSRYAGKKAATEQRASRDGFGGVGVRIETEPRGVRVLSVLKRTPADRAGLRAQDLLTHADGRPLQGLSQDDVIALLRGRVHAPLRLTFQRPDAPQSRTVRLRREQIFLPTVESRMAEDVRVVAISGFNQHTTASVADALRGAAQSARGVVIDLRGNPGGLLDQAVGVADLFIDSGPLLTTQGRHPDSRQSYDAARGDILNGLPLTVVVDGGSASAAEILAAALQDSGRAVTIGAATYGKGSVQTVVRLPNQGELTLTWARLHAPSGYSFHELGVLPALCVDAAEVEAGAALMAAGRAYAPIAEDARRGGDAAAARDGCPWRATAGDAAVDAAIAIAGTPALYAEATALSRGGDGRRTLRAAR